MLGIITMIVSLMLLFNAAFLVGVIPPIVGFVIGWAFIIVGLVVNPKLNKKSNEEKFLEKLQKIEELPIEEHQKKIKKISRNLSASLFLQAALMIVILKTYNNLFDSEFFLHVFDYTLLAAFACDLSGGFYILKFKKLGAIFAIFGTGFQVLSLFWFLIIDYGEFTDSVWILNIGSAWISSLLWKSYKHLK